MQLAQPGSRFGAEFADEDLAGMLVDGQRLGLAAVGIEGEHQRGVQVLAQWMDVGQLPQLGGDIGVAAQVQVRRRCVSAVPAGAAPPRRCAPLQPLGGLQLNVDYRHTSS